MESPISSKNVWGFKWFFGAFTQIFIRLKFRMNLPINGIIYCLLILFYRWLWGIFLLAFKEINRLPNTWNWTTDTWHAQQRHIFVHFFSSTSSASKFLLWFHANFWATSNFQRNARIEKKNPSVFQMHVKTTIK